MAGLLTFPFLPKDSGDNIDCFLHHCTNKKKIDLQGKSNIQHHQSEKNKYVNIMYIVLVLYKLHV